MLNKAESQASRNPWEFWRQWNEITVKMWANAMNNGDTTGTHASGTEGSWMNAMNTVQEHLSNTAQALFNPPEAWKLWFDTTLDICREAINMGSDPAGFLAAWVKVMENIQQRAHTGKSLPIDPFKVFQEWYDAASKPWSKVVEDSIASERFLAFTSPGLENYSHLIKAFRHASEEYLKALRLPTLSDIAHVAEMVVNLEEKVDAIEETIERVKEQQLTQGTTTIEKIANVERRLNQIETRLEKMLALLEKVEDEPSINFW